MILNVNEYGTKYRTSTVNYKNSFIFMAIL